MRRRGGLWLLVCGLIAPILSHAHEQLGLPDEVSTDSDTYHAAFYYETFIDQPPQQVWPHLIQFDTWIDFDFIPISGQPGEVGQVSRLYEGQDFFVQTTLVIPNKVLVSANLPSRYRDEYSTGVTVFALHPQGSGTLVSVTMDRRYHWEGDGLNGTREVRRSAEFLAATDAAWNDRFLPKLQRQVMTTPSP